MRWNPVFRREMTVGSRSIRMMAILFVFNSILAAVALFNMYSVAEQVRTTAGISIRSFWISTRSSPRSNLSCCFSSCRL